MAKYYVKRLHLPVAMLIASSLAACTGAPAKPDEPKVQEFPVKWTQEFDMPSLLDQAPAVSSQKDLGQLLKLPWYASIDVQTSESNQSQTVASCNEYFAIKTASLRALNEYEHNALLEFMVKCEATRLLSEASPAQRSDIPVQPLDTQLPNELPKSFALVTSLNEWNRIKNDPSVSSWNDVSTVTEVERMSVHRAEYRTEGGLQTLSILGRGDFNEDGREDLLASVRDTVEGGSYFNLRLFVLTVTEGGDWQVEAQY